MVRHAQPYSSLEERALKTEFLRRHRASRTTKRSFEATKRELRSAEELRESWHPKQAALYRSRAKRRVAITSRRAGKTIGAAKWMLAHMLEHPTSLCLYIAQTAAAAKVYIWREIKQLVVQYDLPFKFNETNLYMVHRRGGGMLLFKGADKADEIEKLRGPRFDKVLLDEAQTFGAWFENLIAEVLGPCLRDGGGELVMSGTAGKVREGIFYEACHGLRKKRDGTPVYEVHRWTLQDNPYLSAEARDEDNIIDEEGYSGTDDPRFLREYRGLWVVGDEERMFAFDEERNTYDGTLPPGHDWRVGFGCDFGWNDQTAFVVGMWAPTHPCFYVPESWGKSRQYTDDVAARAMELKYKYGSSVFVGDTGGYGKGICVHLQRDYKVHIQQAQKREKFDHIAFFNSALRRGDVKVRRGDPLCKQLKNVAWNQTKTDAANHARDDLAFAMVYIWRHAKNHGLGQRSAPEAEVGDPLTQFAIREKMEALNRDRPRDDAPRPDWVIGDTGAASRSSRYCSPAWSFLLGNG